MKKYILLVIFCLFISVSILGQIKTLTKEEYNSAQKIIQDKVYKTSRRVISIQNSYSNGKIISTRTLTQEYISSDKNRWELITKKNNIVEEKIQILYIGNFEYRKEGETPWEKRCFQNCSDAESSSGVGISGKELPNVKQYLVVETVVDNQPIKVYSFYRVYDYEKSLNFYENRKWINSNGFILKEETKISDILPEFISSIETITYEYNPKDIKPIEAPIK
jgi:hypothetical protein